MPSQLLTRADIQRIAREFTESPGGRTPPEIIDDALAAGAKEAAGKRRRFGDAGGGGAQLNGFAELRSDAEKARALAERLAQPLRESRVRARAVLMPVDDILEGRRWFTRASMDGAVYMRYRQLTVGAGPGNDVPLRRDACARVSGKHAVIFYDDVSVRTSNLQAWRLNHLNWFVFVDFAHRSPARTSCSTTRSTAPR